MGIKDKQQPSAHAICTNGFQIANQDLFGLMIETQRSMAAFGLPSLQFISDMMDAKSTAAEVDVIIGALEKIKKVARINEDWG